MKVNSSSVSFAVAPKFAGVKVDGTPGIGNNKSVNHQNNRGRRNYNSNFKNYKAGQDTGLFEGSEPTLKGFIYDYTGERNLDQFIKTTEQLRIYMGRTYTKYTADFLDAVDDLYLDDPVPPIHPKDTSSRWMNSRTTSQVSTQ